MNQRAIEAGADALRHHERGGSRLTEWSKLTPAKQHLWRDKVNTVLHALAAEGYAVVPREPTQVMTQAAMDALDSPFYADLERVYRAMIAAYQADRWSPPFKVGDRVKHTGRDELGTIASIENGEVVVEFDNKTPSGHASIGHLDRRWFEQHDGWLVVASQETTNASD